MSSRDLPLSDLTESDAHMAQQNVQRMIDSIMDAISALLKQRKKQPEEDKEPPEKGPVLALPEMAEVSLVEPVNIREQPMVLTGAEPMLLNAASPYQLEGQSTQALLKGSSAEPLILAGQVPDDVSIQVGDTAVEGQYGDELRAALMQLSPVQLEQLHQAIDPSVREDIIDAEWEPEPIEIKVNGETIQTQDVAEQELEQSEAVHTALLSSDQVQSSTGQDYSGLDNLNDVGPVIATVDSHGRILYPGYVNEQLGSRAEDAREEYEIDQQREASVEEPEGQRVDAPSPQQERQAIGTLNQLLEMVEADRFEGNRFVVERHDDLMTVTAKDGRGIILVAEGEQVLKSELTDQDLGSFDQVHEVLNRQPALDPGIAVEAPTIAAPALELVSVGSGFEQE